MAELRILQIAHDHPDWTTGGTEIVAHDLARALDRRSGVSARFLAAGTRLHRPEAEPGSLQALGRDFVLITGAYDRFTMLRQDGIAWLDALSRAVQAARPDIVHLHGLDRLGAEIVPALRRMVPEARIVLTLHDYQAICANDGLLVTSDGGLCPGASPDRCRRCLPQIPAARHALRRAHLQAILSQVDVILSPSEFLFRRFLDWGIDPSRFRVLRNGVDPVTAPERLRYGPRSRFAVFGNLARHKGALVALAAAARLAVEGADLTLDLHGGLGWADEAFRSEFERALAAAAPVARHHGPYDRGQLAALMRGTDWVVVPSLWYENAPLVILEAQAAGRPVICAGIGGMAELVQDGINGLHVRPNDPAALAETLRRAALDADLWPRLAGATQPPLSHEAHVEEHLGLYRSLVSTRCAA